MVPILSCLGGPVRHLLGKRLVEQEPAVVRRFLRRFCEVIDRRCVTPELKLRYSAIIEQLRNPNALSLQLSEN